MKGMKAGFCSALSQNDPMDLAILMDIDGTLTPPRRALLPEMAEALKALTVPFHVAAGSDMVLVEPQLLKPLWDFGCRKDFDAFVSNGATQYRCPYSEGYFLRKVSEFDFAHHLGEAASALLMDTLEEVLSSDTFSLPSNVKVIGDRITHRGSMVNFSPIGRPKGDLNDEARRNRAEFARFDQGTGYRRRILAFLNQRLEQVIAAKKLRILLGGETSFDIVIDGKDKTNAVRYLLRQGCRQVVFLGDALFEGGNDSVITDFIRRWEGPGPCPLTAIQVEGWEHTMRVFAERGWMPS